MKEKKEEGLWKIERITISGKCQCWNAHRLVTAECFAGITREGISKGIPQSLELLMGN